MFRTSVGTVLRQVNNCYLGNYRCLMDSGLYQDLVDKRLLVPHEEIDLAAALTAEAAFVIQPSEIPFISHPYEWAFSALKAAALLTLDIQLLALEHGMSLKDASAYNIQFDGIHPIFIDTLSFEKYTPNTAWVAYSQFCRHFLAPLALMARTDICLGRLSQLYIDGVPLDLAARLLPRSTLIRFGLLVHLHLQARMLHRYSSTQSSQKATARSVSQTGLTSLLTNLRKTVSQLHWKPSGTEWADYYDNLSYSSAALDEKKRVIAEALDKLTPATVWDLGANTGMFSRIASQKGARTYSFDIDPACVELNYRESKQSNATNLLPLLLDLTNPSPAIGWAHQERPSFLDRGPADVTLALALIHHLAISNNLPLEHVAKFMAQTCRHLIIEFVPKDDPQVRRLLSSREDIFDKYTRPDFEKAFASAFSILELHDVGTDGRVVYLMEKKLG